MSAAPTPPLPVPPSLWSIALGWVSAKDPGLLAVKRSVRAAVVWPLVFALAHLLFSSSAQVGLVAAFGSFALLLLVDFRGSPRTRLVSYLVLFAVGSCFITLGTLASNQRVIAVIAMALVAFAVLFAGVVSPLVATASTAACSPSFCPWPSPSQFRRLVPACLAGAWSGPSAFPHACWSGRLRGETTSAVAFRPRCPPWAS